MLATEVSSMLALGDGVLDLKEITLFWILIGDAALIEGCTASLSFSLDGLKLIETVCIMFNLAGN